MLFLWNSYIWSDKHVKYPNNPNSLIFSLLFSPVFSASYFQNPHFFHCKQKHVGKVFFKNTLPFHPDGFLIVKGTCTAADCKVLQHRTTGEWHRCGDMESPVWVGLSAGGISGPRGLSGPGKQFLSCGCASSSGLWQGGRDTLACQLTPAARGCKGRSWVSVCCLAKFTNTWRQEKSKSR